MGCAQSREYAKRIKKNDIMEFLIVLKESDFTTKPKCINFHSKITRYADDIPGILNCVSLDNVSNIDDETGLPIYIFRDIVIPRIMYIKLPKENIYVKSDEWEFEYMKSQIQEIIIIFGLIGAKKINYDVSDNSAENQEVAANLGVSDVVTASAQVGLEVKCGQSTYSKYSGKVEFPKPIENIPSLSYILKEDNLYYLPRKFQWRTMVKNRIQSHVTKDSFDYEFGKDVYINSNVTSKFNEIGVGFKFGSNSLSSFRMSFDIEYYEVNNSISDEKLNIHTKN